MRTRRWALGAGLGLGALQLAPTRFAVAGAAAASLDDNRRLEVFTRLAASHDDRLIIWWLDGIRYGVVDAICRPLYGMQVGMFHLFERVNDGGVRFAIFELTYYTDLATGALLQAWDNPYTGERNRVVHVRLGPTIRRQSSTGLKIPPDPTVREYASELSAPLVSGAMVWFRTDVTARIVLPFPKAPEIVLNHYTTVSGHLDAALDAAQASVPATLAFQNVIRWEPWMKMGDRPGHLMSRAAGRKLLAVEELPAGYRAMADRMHPDYVADPVARLRAALAKPDPTPIA